MIPTLFVRKKEATTPFTCFCITEIAGFLGFFIDLSLWASLEFVCCLVIGSWPVVYMYLYSFFPFEETATRDALPSRDSERALFHSQDLTLADISTISTASARVDSAFAKAALKPSARLESNFCRTIHSTIEVEVSPAPRGS